MKSFCVTLWNPEKKETILKAFFETEKASKDVFNNYCQRNEFKGMEVKIWHYCNINSVPVLNNFEWCILENKTI